MGGGDVLKPSHYNRDGLDLFAACKNGLWSKEKYKGFLELNIVKYVMRYEEKNGLEDLHKARVYLNELINEVEEE